ncbi:MAG: FG-GAP repeat protein [Phycisphaerales bacterium]|nr:FG-GAP repeat protein [Phycisphaerales bacterium]
MAQPRRIIVCGLAAAACLPASHALAQGWAQVDKVYASDGAELDYFGCDIDLSGEIAIVGAWGDDGGGEERGSAYIVRRSGAGWAQTAKIRAADGTARDRFGLKVAIDGGVAVVGAPYDDPMASDSGAAYVFRRDANGDWRQEAKLVPSVGGDSDYFGRALAIEGGTIVVGAYNHDEGGQNAGAAFVFEFDGSQWVETAKLTAFGGAVGEWFGTSVGISGDTVLVGAPGDSGSSHAGFVCAFERDAGHWTGTQRFSAGDPSQYLTFGFALAIDGDMAAIGAPGGGDVGAVYAFERAGGVWSESQQVLPSQHDELDSGFGWAVALEGDRLAVGEPEAEIGDAGAAFVFRMARGSWVEEAMLVPSDVEDGDHFGSALAVSDGRVVAGVADDSDLARFAGAMYIFAPACDADFDTNGLIDVRDVLAFLNAWNADAPRSDINGDGAIDTRDVLAFLNLWQAGC